MYKDILDQMARADQEIAEAEMLELEAAAAADQHLVDQAGDESDDLDMEELLDDVGMNLCGNQPARRVQRHRHAIEQASRRWRGGRRGDSGERAVNLISAQVHAHVVQQLLHVQVIALVSRLID